MAANPKHTIHENYTKSHQATLTARQLRSDRRNPFWVDNDWRLTVSSSRRTSDKTGWGNLVEFDKLKNLLALLACDSEECLTTREKSLLKLTAQLAQPNSSFSGVDYAFGLNSRD
jgi:hypothetical protein